MSFFLFGTAHDELWRQVPGTLVAVLNARVKADGEASLSANAAEQVWVLGASPEFGYCKALKKVPHGPGRRCGDWRRSVSARRVDGGGTFARTGHGRATPRILHTSHPVSKAICVQDGTSCKMPVNLGKCPYCPYHVQASAGDGWGQAEGGEGEPHLQDWGTRCTASPRMAPGHGS